jgi:hypothetical protein
MRLTRSAVDCGKRTGGVLRDGAALAGAARNADRVIVEFMSGVSVCTASRAMCPLCAATPPRDIGSG